jgi:hypothetical protein
MLVLVPALCYHLCAHVKDPNGRLLVNESVAIVHRMDNLPSPPPTVPPVPPSLPETPLVVSISWVMGVLIVGCFVFGIIYPLTLRKTSLIVPHTTRGPVEL